MSEFFLGDIKIMNVPFTEDPPYGWAWCDGQEMDIAYFTNLFNLIGYSFGKGKNDDYFLLPDLRNRTIVCAGNQYEIGAYGGENRHTLSAAEIPTHEHELVCSDGDSNSNSPEGNYLSTAEFESYAALSDSGEQTLSNASITSLGIAAHENRQPFLAMRFCIAITGPWPQQTH